MQKTVANIEKVKYNTTFKRIKITVLNVIAFTTS